MTPTESVLWDAMLQAGYTERQAARALVALTLPEQSKEMLEKERWWRDNGAAGFVPLEKHAPYTERILTVEAERRGLPKEEM